MVSSSVVDLTKVIGKTLVATPERRQEADADWDVVKKVQAGDVAAFDQLILKYRERVYSVIYNLCANREDAAISRRAPSSRLPVDQPLPGPVFFFTWLYRIGVNATLTHLRKNRCGPSSASIASMRRTNCGSSRSPDR